MTWMPHAVDADREFDDMVIRVAEGLECPRCHREHIERTFPLRIPMFRCRHCKAEWFDATKETA